jgi:lipopolysaccharide export LptBFGC system permease protein LptF
MSARSRSPNWALASGRGFLGWPDWMRLLDRYLLRELCLPLAVCLAGFTVFWVAFDLFSGLDRFQQAQLTVADVVEFYWIGLPELLTTTLPVGLLLALLYALTHHARHHELTAMRAAGQSLWRILLPYLGVGFVASGLLYWLTERVAPDARERQDLLLQRRISTTAEAERAWRGPLNFNNDPAVRSWSIGQFHLLTGDLRQPRLRMMLSPGARREVAIQAARWTDGAWRWSGVRETLWRHGDDSSPAVRETLATPVPPLPPPDQLMTWSGGSFAVSNGVWRTNLVWRAGTGELEWRIASLNPALGEVTGLVAAEPLGVGAQRQFLADGARWEGGWVFTNGQEFIFRNGRDREPLWLPDVRELPELDETPEMLRSELRLAAMNRNRALRKPELSAREVLEYKRLHPNLRREVVAWLDTQLHARLAAPWTCLVVVLIAFPFATPSGRRNVFYGVAGSIGLAFAFFVVQRIGFVLGQNGALPAWLGAWLPNMVFAALGLGLTARVR